MTMASMPTSLPESSPESGEGLRLLRVIHLVLFATVGMYWVVLEQLQLPACGEMPEALHTGFALLALATAGGVGFLRWQRIPAVALDSRLAPEVQRARLRVFYLVCFLLSESVALYGFALRLLGESREGVVPFFLGAGALFLLCYPRGSSRRGGDD